MVNTRKLGVSGTAGSIAVLVTWILSSNGVEVPPEAAAAVGTLLGSLMSMFKQDA